MFGRFFGGRCFLRRTQRVQDLSQEVFGQVVSVCVDDCGPKSLSAWSWPQSRPPVDLARGVCGEHEVMLCNINFDP